MLSIIMSDHQFNQLHEGSWSIDANLLPLYFSVCIYLDS